MQKERPDHYFLTECRRRGNGPITRNRYRLERLDKTGKTTHIATVEIPVLPTGVKTEILVALNHALGQYLQEK